jgi:hypothetical protein
MLLKSCPLDFFRLVLALVCEQLSLLPHQVMAQAFDLIVARINQLLEVSLEVCPAPLQLRLLSQFTPQLLIRIGQGIGHKVLYLHSPGGTAMNTQPNLLEDSASNFVAEVQGSKATVWVSQSVSQSLVLKQKQKGSEDDHPVIQVNSEIPTFFSFELSRLGYGPSN